MLGSMFGQKMSQLITRGVVSLVQKNKAETIQQIMNISKELEKRETRQIALCREYVNGIKFLEGNNSISISDLTQKYPYMMQPKYILQSLYSYVNMKNLPKIQNMFSLPLEKTFFNVPFNEKDSSQSAYLNKKYTESINELSSVGSLKRIVAPEKYMGCILNKGNDYDHVKVELMYRTVDNEPVNFFDERGFEIKHDAPIFLHLVEQKDLTRTLDVRVIENILNIAKKNSNSYIGVIDGVVIENKFDDSNVYDPTEYDKIYGSGSFHAALLHIFNSFFDSTGNESIRHEKTIELIKNKALLVTKNDEKLADRIAKDFIEGSEHSCSDTIIEIGKVMDLYGIAGHELLFVMFRNNIPFGMGVPDFLLNGRSMDDFTLDDARARVKDNQYVDYLKGVPIKNNFRKIQGERQKINIHKFDSRSSHGKFYECILWLMQYKFHNANRLLS
jgi:hypothetical protein